MENGSNNNIRHANDIEDLFEQLYNNNCMSQESYWNMDEYFNDKDVAEFLLKQYNENPSIDIYINSSSSDQYTITMHEHSYTEGDDFVISCSQNDGVKCTCNHKTDGYHQTGEIVGIKTLNSRMSEYISGNKPVEITDHDAGYFINNLTTTKELTEYFRNKLADDSSIYLDSVVVMPTTEGKIIITVNGKTIYTSEDVVITNDKSEINQYLDSLAKNTQFHEYLNYAQTYTNLRNNSYLVDWAKDKLDIDYHDLNITYNKDGTVSITSKYYDIITSEKPITSKQELYEFLENSTEAIDNMKKGSLITKNNSEIIEKVKSQIYKDYGILPGLEVNIINQDENGSYELVVSATSFEEPITVKINYVGYDDIQIKDNSADILTQTVNSVQDQVNNDSTSNALLNLQLYLNQNIKNSYVEAKIAVEGGQYYICTDSYKIPVTLADINDFSKEGNPVQEIINIANAKNEFYYDEEGNPKAVNQDIDIVPANDKDGNVKYYYYVNGQKFSATSIDEAKEGIQTELTNNSNYASNNSRLSRKRNKAISDIDEEKYNTIIEQLKEADIEADKLVANCNINTDGLNEYYKKLDRGLHKTITASDQIKIVKRKFNDISEDINFLCKLIDSIVYLYINCDDYMRQVLDGLFSGEVTANDGFVKSNNSFVDYVFKLRNGDISLYNNHENFEKAYTSLYNTYVTGLTNLGKKSKVLGSGDKVYIGELDDKAKDFYEKNGIVIDADGCADMEKISELFAQRILNDDTNLSESEREIIDNETFEYIVKPYQQSLYVIEALADYPETISAINDLEVFKNHNDFIETILSDDYHEKLKDIRNNGVNWGQKTLIGLGDIDITDILFNPFMEGIDLNKADFMTPAELALVVTLAEEDIGAAKAYIDTFDYKVTKRQGEAQAARELLTIFSYPTEADIVAGIKAFDDGLKSTFTDIYHIFQHDSTSEEWKNYYMSKYLTDMVDMDYAYLQSMYNNGEISRDMFMAYKGLFEPSNKDALSTNRKIYTVSNKAGVIVKEAVEDIALTAATGGSGPMLKTAIKSTIKGLSAAGNTMNKNSNSMVYRDFDTDFYVNAWEKGGIVAMSTFITECCKNKIKYGSDWKRFTMNPTSGTEAALETAYTTSGVTAPLASKAFRISWDGKSVCDEALENIVPLYKLGSTLNDADKMAHVGCLFLSYLAKSGKGLANEYVDYTTNYGTYPTGDKWKDLLKSFGDECLGYGVFDELVELTNSDDTATEDWIFACIGLALDTSKKGVKSSWEEK